MNVPYSIKYPGHLLDPLSLKRVLIGGYMVYTVGWSPALSMCCIYVHSVSTGMSCEASSGKWTVGGGIVVPARYIIFGEKEHKKEMSSNQEGFGRTPQVWIHGNNGMLEGGVTIGGLVFFPHFLFLRKGGEHYWNMGTQWNKFGSCGFYISPTLWPLVLLYTLSLKMNNINKTLFLCDRYIRGGGDVQKVYQIGHFNTLSRVPLVEHRALSMICK